MNKREQLMAWVLGGVVGLAAIYYGGSWWWGTYTGVQADIVKLTTKKKTDLENVEKGKKALEQIKKLNVQTIDPAHPDTAPTDALVRNYYHNSGLVISSWAQAGLRPSASTGGKDAAKDFMECRYTATATTSTARLARFLQTIENLSIPARIDGITITTPKPGVDQLRVELSISALVYAPKVAPASTGKANATTAASRSATGTRSAATRGTGSQPGGRTTQAATGTAAVTDPNDTSDIEKRMAANRAAEAARMADSGAAASATAPAASKTLEQIQREMELRRARELGTTLPAAESTTTSTKPLGGNP